MGAEVVNLSDRIVRATVGAEVAEGLCHMGFADADGSVQDDCLAGLEPAQGGKVASSVEVAQPMLAAPRCARPTWNVDTMVEPCVKVSGSTSVRCWLSGLVYGSELTSVSETTADALGASQPISVAASASGTDRRSIEIRPLRITVTTSSIRTAERDEVRGPGGSSGDLGREPPAVPPTPAGQPT